MFNLGGIFVSLKADKQQFDDTLDHAERRARTFATNWERMGQGMAKAFAMKQVTDVGVAAINQAADSFISYEKRLVGLSKASDQTGERLTFLRGRLEDLATSMKGVALNDIVDIATEVSKMGTPTGEIVEMTRGIAMLSQAIDDLPASEVANSIGKINNVFGLGGKGALQLGSAIDKLADSGTSSASEIMRVMQYVSGTAKAMNISAQESLGFAAALLNTGVRAEESGTTLKKLFGILSQTDSSTAKPRSTILGLLGMNAESFQAAREKSPVAILIQLLEKLKTLSLDEQSDALRNLGMGSASEAGPLQNLMGNIDGVKTGIGQAKEEFVSLSQIMKSVAADADRVGAALTQAFNVQERAINRLGESASGLKLAFNKLVAWELDSAAGVSEMVGSAVTSVGDSITGRKQKAQEEQRKQDLAKQAHFQQVALAAERKRIEDEARQKITDFATFLRTDPGIRSQAKRFLNIPKSREEFEKEFIGPKQPLSGGAGGLPGMQAAMSLTRNAIFGLGASASGPLAEIRKEQLAPLGQVLSGADIAGTAQRAIMESAQQDKERDSRVLEDSLAALQVIAEEVTKANNKDNGGAAFR